jgi:carboxyl-terminal processing protease
MRSSGRFVASASSPRNLVFFALAGAIIGAVATGWIPAGPQPSGAVEAKLAAELTAPSASDRTVTRMVTLLMKREHLTKHPLDDEISRRGLDVFIKSLDGMKLYFYQSDVEEFNRRRNDLDDMVQNGDVTFAYTIFNRLLKRVDERVNLVNAADPGI